MVPFVCLIFVAVCCPLTTSSNWDIIRLILARGLRLMGIISQFERHRLLISNYHVCWKEPYITIHVLTKEVFALNFVECCKHSSECSSHFSFLSTQPRFKLCQFPALKFFDLCKKDGRQKSLYTLNGRFSTLAQEKAYDSLCESFDTFWK